MYYTFIILITASLLNYANPRSLSLDTSNTLTNYHLSNSTFNTHLYIQHYDPYCGGAAPTKEMMNNYTPASGPYILINHSDSTESNVIANNGIIKLQLSPGRYSIRETYKNIPFSDFYTKHAVENGMYKQNTSEDCYRIWWETNLFEFEITDTTTLIKEEATISSRCFTGINPCQIYTGPYPP